MKTEGENFSKTPPPYVEGPCSRTLLIKKSASTLSALALHGTSIDAFWLSRLLLNAWGESKFRQVELFHRWRAAWTRCGGHSSSTSSLRSCKQVMRMVGVAQMRCHVSSMIRRVEHSSNSSMVWECGSSRAREVAVLPESIPIWTHGNRKGNTRLVPTTMTNELSESSHTQQWTEVSFSGHSPTHQLPSTRHTRLSHH